MQAINGSGRRAGSNTLGGRADCRESQGVSHSLSRREGDEKDRKGGRAGERQEAERAIMEERERATDAPMVSSDAPSNCSVQEHLLGLWHQA